MKIIAVIPARMSSSRLPNKMMQPLGDKTLIRSTYDNVVQMQLFDQVIVATDSQEIFDEISHHQGLAIMTKNEHQTGSDRIAEVVKPMEVDIIVNVQGDEPFVSREALVSLIKSFKQDITVDVATLKMPILDNKEIENPNNVKVICNYNDFALYFSRTPIPYQRDQKTEDIRYFQHIGVYAFRKKALMDFSILPMRSLEKAEKIECLRYLEYGMRIKVLETQEKTIGVDTLEDLERARDYLQNLNS